MNRRGWLSTMVAMVSVLTAAFVVGCVPRGMGFSPTPDPVTLRFAYREHTIDPEYLVNQFHEKHPWITIELVQLPRWGNDLDNHLVAGGIDVFQEGRSALEYAERDIIRPLDDIQLGDWSGIRDDYYSGAWEGLNVMGIQWGVPAGLDMIVGYVNMDQAHALRVDVPVSSWDMFDFLELTTKLNYPEGLPHAESASLYGFCTDQRGFDPIIFIYMHGGGIVDNINAPSEATLDDPLTVEAVQWYSDLHNAHRVSPHADVLKKTFRRGGVYEAVVRGACGVWLGWYGNRGGLDTRWEWSADWRMLPLPRDRETFGLGDVTGYFITQECEHPKEALMFLRFLADQPSASGQKLPPRRSLVTSDEYKEMVGEEVAAVASEFSDRIIVLPAESGPALEKVAGQLYAAVNQIITEDLPASQVLGEAQQQIRDAFKQAQ